jgi:hypothetical protein
MDEDCYQVRAPYFTAGFMASGEVCTRAAPIIKYLLGWDLSRIHRWARSKGFIVEYVPPLEPQIGEHNHAQLG